MLLLCRSLRPHRHVVLFIGVTPPPKVCIVTEFLDGGTLSGILLSDVTIDPSRLYDVVLGIAAGRYLFRIWFFYLLKKEISLYISLSLSPMKV